MRTRSILSFLLAPAFVFGAGQGPQYRQNATPKVTQLNQVQRIYVEPLTGTAAAQALRELIIASLNSTKLFVLTDNPDRADATLKGAADDKAFEDTFDTDTSMSGRSGAGIYSLTGRSTKSGGGYGAESNAQRESHRIKERKHEAYATVRLCNNVGDVIWSTTQESLGAKFHGASADVAAKIARQLSIDFDASRRPASAELAPPLRP
ncbi:MAG: hypothetical protein ACJ746_32115 [Bryobacteraceae bacterium]